MASIIFIIAFLIEAGFATYCIITKSNQSRVRSLIRVGALVAFVLFTLAAVIQWGSRWYLLALLLLLWAALGAWALIRKKEEKKAYKAWRSVARAITALLLVFIALLPAMVFPQYKPLPVTGPHPVATALYTYTDSSRVETFSKTGGNRAVNVEFWYPKDAAAGDKYPLVVFSHGTGGTKSSNISAFMELASNGYVVCSIDHPYHALFTVDANRHMIPIDQSYLQQYMAVSSGKYDDATDLKLEQQWVNLRVADINFVLDTILQRAEESGSGSVYQLIDTGKIGLFGHSLGGESSAQVARERVAKGRNDISAVIDLDAEVSGEYLGLQDGKPVLNDKPYPAPILFVFSDTLVKLMNKVPNPTETIAAKHLVATAPNAYEIDLPGTDHMSMTDMPLMSPLLVKLINSSVPTAGGVEADPYATTVKLNKIILTFFNVYLKGQGAFASTGW